jgi:hypothetical protein
MPAKGKILYFEERSDSNKEYYTQQMAEFVLWFEQTLELPIYIIYGTLIGACRERKFIDHDYDVDLAYLSKETEISKIVEEKEKILKILSQQGLLVKRFNDGHNHIKLLDRQIIVDLWTSWFDKDKFYCTGFYNGTLDKKDIIPFQYGYLYKQIFKIPINSDKVLTEYYGNWRVPQLKWKQTTQWVGLPKPDAEN